MVKVAAIRVVLFSLVSPFGVIVFLKNKVFDALDHVVVAYLKHFYGELLIRGSRVFFLFCHLHRKSIDVLAVRGEGRGAHATRGTLPLFFSLLLFSLFLLLVFVLLGELLLGPVEFLQFLVVTFGMLELCRVSGLNWLQGLLVVDHEWLILDSIMAHEKLAIVDDHGDSLEALALGVDGIHLLPVAHGPLDGPSQPTELAVVEEEIFICRERVVGEYHLI